MSLFELSNEADNDLIEIYRYGYLNHGNRNAELYQKALKEKCQFLADNPRLYRERDKFTPPVCIHHHKKHLIIYTLEADNILIARFCHERMDIPQHLEN